jgi:catechol 2,3-dioxygenase-like lactoylglutathione lyase family enzyme
MFQPQPPQRVVETALYADDLESAQRFYASVLGLPVIGHEPGRHVFFAVGSGSVLLIFDPAATCIGDALPAHGASGPGHVALGIAADELDAWRARLLAHGVPIEREAAWPRGGRSLYFRDPAGNLLELVTPGIWGTSDGW